MTVTRKAIAKWLASPNAALNRDVDIEQFKVLCELAMKGLDGIEALRPLAMLGGPDDGCAAAYHDLEDDVVLYQNSGQCITAGDVRAARKLVSAYVQPPTAHRTDRTRV